MIRFVRRFSSRLLSTASSPSSFFSSSAARCTRYFEPDSSKKAMLSVLVMWHSARLLFAFCKFILFLTNLGNQLTFVKAEYRHDPEYRRTFTKVAHGHFL